MISKFYEIIDGVRHVIPYTHEFSTHCKGRWVGKEIFQVVTTEFGGHSKEYWENAISDGNVKVNHQKIEKSYVFCNNDYFTHITHRHEPPVVGNIEYIGNTDDLLAVSKPASLACHACGAYKYNSLLQILINEPMIPDQPRLNLVDRLDRVTSGLVILAKSPVAANRISKEIQAKATTKVYLARIKGRFPGQLSHLRLLNDDELKNFIIETSAEGDNGKEGDDDGGEERVDKRARESGKDSKNNKYNKKAKLQSASGTASAFSSAYVELPSTDPVQQLESSTNEITNNIHGGHRAHYLFQSMSREDIGQHQRVGYHVSTQNVSPSAQIQAMDLSKDETLNTNTVYTLVCPLAPQSYRDGLHACHPVHGKQSITRFRPLKYNSVDDTTLVECQLLTGRTHQIRLHLQLLNSSIANDPCYGGSLFYGEPQRHQQALKLLRRMRSKGYVPLAKVPRILLDEVETLEAQSAADSSASDSDRGSDEKRTVPKDEPTSHPHAQGATLVPLNTHIAAQSTQDATNDATSKDKYAENISVSAADAVDIKSYSSNTTSILGGSNSSNGAATVEFVGICRFCEEKNSSMALERVLHCDGIWLHCLLMAGASWGFEAPFPAWAVF